VEKNRVVGDSFSLGIRLQIQAFILQTLCTAGRIAMAFSNLLMFGNDNGGLDNSSHQIDSMNKY